MKKNVLIGSLLIIVIFFSFELFSNYQYLKYKNFILNNYQITVGKIVSYSISGDADNRILGYSYIAYDQKYFRKITPSIFFDDCQQDISNCAKKTFHVIYSTTSPEMSLIDLTNEISELDSLYVIGNTIKFE